MKQQKLRIGGIPAIVWGEDSPKAYLYVHGKLSNKESAASFAQIAADKGYQTLSFDLPAHGEREDVAERCDIWTGIRDLRKIGDCVFQCWESVSLFACSLGAFFSLHTYAGKTFENCLFQSPVVDMEYLIRQMCMWFHVTEETLRERGEIATPLDTLSWPYYCYVREHPISQWSSPTHILYAAKDNLQSKEVVERFVQRFHCQLTVAWESEHPFLGAGDARIVQRWLLHNL